MGIDAAVFCDCFERGKLRAEPPPEWKVYVDYDGGRACGSENIEILMSFDRWNHADACVHQHGILLHHRIGNIALVGAIRGHLQEHAAQLPLILEKVVYSGIHAGDLLALDEVRQLQSELDALHEVHSDGTEMEESLRDFEKKLRDLCECSLHVGKPIAFT